MDSFVSNIHVTSVILAYSFYLGSPVAVRDVLTALPRLQNLTELDMHFSGFHSEPQDPPAVYTLYAYIDLADLVRRATKLVKLKLDCTGAIPGLYDGRVKQDDADLLAVFDAFQHHRSIRELEFSARGYSWFSWNEL